FTAAPQPQAAPMQARQAEPEPAVAEGEDEPPLFPERTYGADRRKGGWLGLFGGRPRTEETPAAPTYRQSAGPGARGGAVPATQAEDAPAESEDDLEIPSFLRRLAN
ncbi:MAG: cell division protein FtsZ, partial [Pseudomonadota bacterium]|nr:cell division protein FtsZ [Pseudomonadota bacterium]